MKFQNRILINFVTEAQTDGCTHRQAESSMPLQLSKVWGIINEIKHFTLHQNTHATVRIKVDCLGMVLIHGMLLSQCR